MHKMHPQAWSNQFRLLSWGENHETMLPIQRIHGVLQGWTEASGTEMCNWSREWWVQISRKGRSTLKKFWKKKDRLKAREKPFYSGSNTENSGSSMCRERSMGPPGRWNIHIGVETVEDRSQREQIKTFKGYEYQFESFKHHPQARKITWEVRAWCCALAFVMSGQWWYSSWGTYSSICLERYWTPQWKEKRWDTFFKGGCVQEYRWIYPTEWGH